MGGKGKDRTRAPSIKSAAIESGHLKLRVKKSSGSSGETAALANFLSKPRGNRLGVLKKRITRGDL